MQRMGCTFVVRKQQSYAFSRRGRHMPTFYRTDVYIPQLILSRIAPESATRTCRLRPDLGILQCRPSGPPLHIYFYRDIGFSRFICFNFTCRVYLVYVAPLYNFVCIHALRHSQYFFSHIGTFSCLPRFNQY